MTEATMPRHPTTIRLEVERAFADHRLIEYSIWEIEALERKLTEEQQEHKATLSLAREAREEIERLNGVISDARNWISVEKRMPDRKEPIVYARPHPSRPDHWHVGIAYWTVSERWNPERESTHAPEGFSHWIPLPEAPK